MSTYYERVVGSPHGGPPPDPPEYPVGAETQPRWPAWYAPVGFLSAIAATFVLFAIATIITTLVGVDASDDPPGLTVVLTLMQAATFCGIALVFAANVRRPKAWHFGLRRGRFWPSVGWAAAGMFAFYFGAVIYGLIVSPDGEQGVTEELGADEGTLALLLAGAVVIVSAPLLEEFFFRGFFFRALRSRFSLGGAAILDGLLFGLIHIDPERLSETLPFIPVLALFGVLLCLVYERTGTLYAPIAMHAANNSIAYSFQVDGGWLAAAVFAPLMLLACMFGPRLLHPPRTAAA